MTQLNRRQFSALLLAGAAQAPRLFGAVPSIADVLAASRDRRGIPNVAAMAIDANKTLFSGGVGMLAPGSNVPVDADTIYPIASMTKPVTSVAAMQMVERGLVDLDEPVSRVLPRLKDVQVLTGFDGDDNPILRPPKTPVTLRHLLSHISGLSYGVWHAMAQKYESTHGVGVGQVAPDVPLMFDPGTSWQYGYGADWAGKLVEALSGQTLEEYFQEHIFQPLGMHDTSFDLPAGKFDRFAQRYNKTSAGQFNPAPRVQPPPTQDYNGGGGLNSTANDYSKFMRMILRFGQGPGRTEILKAATVREMSKNQIGSLRAGVLKSSNPGTSADVDTQPGSINKWGLGFLINPEPHEGGRLSGSLAWAGIWNTYFWIDPMHQIAGVVMMQYLPFFDADAVGLLDDFERAVYANF